MNWQRKSSGLFIAVLAGFIVLQITAVAQLDEAERLVYLAKAIKRIVVKQIDKGQPEDAGKAKVQKSFEVKAYDKDGKEVDVSSDQANKLYKWNAKNSSGMSVDQKGIIEQAGSANDKTSKAKNVLKLAMDKGQKAAKLEVRLADQFSAYSSAVGKSSIAMGKGGAGMFKSIGQWIGKHPYWSTAGAVVVAGGVAAAAGGGGGDDSSCSSCSGTGTTIGSQAVPAGTVDVTGTWHGSVNHGTSITLNLSQSGTSVSGSFQESGADYFNSGSLSGSVNGNIFNFTAIGSTDSSSETATVNGNTMTGSDWTASR